MRNTLEALADLDRQFQDWRESDKIHIESLARMTTLVTQAEALQGRVIDLLATGRASIDLFYRVNDRLARRTAKLTYLDLVRSVNN